MGMWMPYLTGGFASGAFEFDAQTVPPSAPLATETATSRNGGGGYIGVGLDYALARARPAARDADAGARKDPASDAAQYRPSRARSAAVHAVRFLMR